MTQQTMRAIRYHEHGTAEVLRLERIPIPVPNEGEVLVRVRAAGVNPVDWKQRSGSNPNLPATPGIDLSGVVEEAGPGVTGFEPGQEVWGTGQGTYAEYAIAPSSSLVPKPPTMSFEEGASIGVGVRTAWAGLFDSADLQKGQTPWTAQRGKVDPIKTFKMLMHERERLDHLEVDQISDG